MSRSLVSKDMRSNIPFGMTYSEAIELRQEAYLIYHGLDKTGQTSGDKKYQEALEKFQESFAARKSPIVLLYIAACYDQLGKYNEAVETLQKFTDKYSHENKLLPLAYQKMASVYLKQGKLNDALGTLNTLSSQEGDIYKDLALMESGKVLEKMGRLEEAQKKYQELSSKYPTSPFIEEARSKLLVNVFDGSERCKVEYSLDRAAADPRRT